MLLVVVAAAGLAGVVGVVGVVGVGVGVGWHHGLCILMQSRSCFQQHGKDLEHFPATERAFFCSQRLKLETVTKMGNGTSVNTSISYLCHAMPCISIAFLFRMYHHRIG